MQARCGRWKRPGRGGRLPGAGVAGVVRAAALLAVAVVCTAVAATAQAAPRGCLSECTPRIAIVSAFGQEAAILVAETRGKRRFTLNGNRFTTGTLRGNRVVIVLSGVSMINSAMVTQLMLDHFRVQRLVMSGISGGLNPAHRVGDVLIPERWAMPMEVYWHADGSTPAPCGAASDVSCLGLKLAQPDGRPLPPFALPSPSPSPSAPDGVPTGLFVRDNFVMTAANTPGGEFRFDYPVDAAMLAVARGITPALARCGPKGPGDSTGAVAGGASGGASSSAASAATAVSTAAAATGAAVDPKRCVAHTPRVIVGGRGVSGTAFLANPAYRRYLFEQLGAQTVEMETAALAHVAYANGIPYIAFRSLSDLAGGEAFDADVAALFTSGLAEANEAAVTLSFLDAWAKAQRAGPLQASRR